MVNTFKFRTSCLQLLKNVNNIFRYIKKCKNLQVCTPSKNFNLINEKKYENLLIHERCWSNNTTNFCNLHNEKEKQNLVNFKNLACKFCVNDLYNFFIRFCYREYYSFCEDDHVMIDENLLPLGYSLTIYNKETNKMVQTFSNDDFEKAEILPFNPSYVFNNQNFINTANKNCDDFLSQLIRRNVLEKSYDDKECLSSISKNKLVLELIFPNGMTYLSKIKSLPIQNNKIGCFDNGTQLLNLKNFYIASQYWNDIYTKVHLHETASKVIPYYTQMASKLIKIFNPDTIIFNGFCVGSLVLFGTFTKLIKEHILLFKNDLNNFSVLQEKMKEIYLINFATPKTDLFFIQEFLSAFNKYYCMDPNSIFAYYIVSDVDWYSLIGHSSIVTKHNDLCEYYDNVNILLYKHFNNELNIKDRLSFIPSVHNIKLSQSQNYVFYLLSSFDDMPIKYKKELKKVDSFDNIVMNIFRKRFNLFYNLFNLQNTKNIFLFCSLKLLSLFRNLNLLISYIQYLINVFKLRIK